MEEANASCFYVEPHHLTTVGYGFDIGGSLAKLAYVKKGNRNSTGKVCVATKTFPKSQIDELVEYIRLHCEGGTPQHTLTATGFGTNLNKTKLQNALGVKLNMVLEFDCFAKSLVWSMKNLPLSRVLHEPSEEAQRLAGESLKAWANVKFNLPPEAKETSTESEDVISEQNNNEQASDFDWCYISRDEQGSADHFPCMVAMLGSGVGFYTVTETREHYLLDGSNVGGQSLTALAKLITGAKDFTELMELATRGDPMGVDTCGFHMRSKGETMEGSDFYTSYPPKQTVYCFGQLNESEGPFKKEDLAASFVTSFCMQVSSMAHTVAKLHKLRRIVFAGSLPEHPFIRQELERVLLQRLTVFDPTREVKFGFLQNGGQLGALGTMLV